MPRQVNVPTAIPVRLLECSDEHAIAALTLLTRAAVPLMILTGPIMWPPEGWTARMIAKECGTREDTEPRAPRGRAARCVYAGEAPGVGSSV